MAQVRCPVCAHDVGKNKKYCSMKCRRAAEGRHPDGVAAIPNLGLVNDDRLAWMQEDSMMRFIDVDVWSDDGYVDIGLGYEDSYDGWGNVRLNATQLDWLMDTLTKARIQLLNAAHRKS